MAMDDHRFRSYFLATAVVAAAAAIAALVRPHVAPVNLVMIFVLAVVAAALGLGRGPSTLTALLAVAAFDFFFVPPHLTFAVDDMQYLLTFAALLIVGLTISTLTARLRQQAEGARAREQRANALYELSRDLAEAGFEEALWPTAVRHTRALFGGSVAVLLPGASGEFEPQAGSAEVAVAGVEREAIEWVQDHGRPAGWQTQTLRQARGLFVPLPGEQGEVLGVLGVHWKQQPTALPEDPVRLLETFANQIALALGRMRRSATVAGASPLIESGRLR